MIRLSGLPPAFTSGLFVHHEVHMESFAWVNVIIYFMPPLWVFMVFLETSCRMSSWRRVVLRHVALVSFSLRPPDLCLTMYTISQDDLKSNHVIKLEEAHYFESPAEVRLCLRFHNMTFLLPWSESGLLAAGWLMEDEMETEVILEIKPTNFY